MIKHAVVTGGGGSIGLELCRQLSHVCEKLTVIDLSELNLYEAEQALTNCSAQVRLLLGDVRDRDLIESIVKLAPDTIFHAAALKHVPLLQDPHNLIEAVKTNVLGTANVLKAGARGAATVMVVSTDKAVQPLSVMGWTKHMAEELVRHYATEPGTLNKVGFVRFGNVIGSSGSVVPLFQKQIAGGGPVTITHPDMVRFFMTIQEAVELVRRATMLLAASSGRMSSFVFDMGQPQRIQDVAEQMIRFSGKTVPIKVIGLRPGEKLYEELTWPHEEMRQTRLSKIRRIIGGKKPLVGEFSTAMCELENACLDRNVDALKAIMKTLNWEGYIIQ